MVDQTNRDTIINDSGFRDYILFLLVGGILIEVGLISGDVSWIMDWRVAILVFLGIVAVSAVLFIINSKFTAFSFNGVTFDARYKKTCKHSDTIKRIADLNVEYSQKMDDLVYEFEYACSSLEMFHLFSPKKYVRENIQQDDLSARMERNAQLRERYDGEFLHLSRLASGMEKELVDTMHRNFNQKTGLARVEWFVTTLDGEHYCDRRIVAFYVGDSGEIAMFDSENAQGFDEFVELEDWLDGEAYGCQYTGVYVLYNMTKDIYYVGQSKNVKRRVRQHLAGYGCKELYEDYTNGDKIAVYSQSLLDSGYDNLDAFEQDMIEKYNAYSEGYNKNSGNEVRDV